MMGIMECTHKHNIYTYIYIYILMIEKKIVIIVAEGWKHQTFAGTRVLLEKTVRRPRATIPPLVPPLIQPLLLLLILPKIPPLIPP